MDTGPKRVGVRTLSPGDRSRTPEKRVSFERDFFERTGQDSSVSTEQISPLLSQSSVEEPAYLRAKGLSPEQIDNFLDGGFSEIEKLHQTAAEYVSRSPSPILSFTASSGASAVLLAEREVYQFYNKEGFEKAGSFPEQIEGFVKKISSDPAQRLIAWERVVPIKKSGLGEREIDRVLKEAEGALGRLHEKGFIHGDSRLDNLGIDRSNKAAWFDFDRSVETRDVEKQNKDIADFKESVRLRRPAPARPAVASPAWRPRNKVVE